MKVVECTSSQEWDNFVHAHGGHPLQLWGWGEVKAAHGWKVKRLFVYENDNVALAAQLLVRPLPWPFRSIAYIPRGPVVRGDATFHVKIPALSALTFHVKKEYQPLLLKIEPDVTQLDLVGTWKKSSQTIQAAKTIQLDLAKQETELLAGMAKKTRQYIRKSSSDVTIVEMSFDKHLQECMDIYKQTSARANFPLHEESYYKAVATDMGSNGVLYGARVGKQLVAFLWLCKSKSTAFELYGGMTDEGQRSRANYALKWHAIQEMKKAGVCTYDFGGLVGTGVTNFKMGWSENETVLVGAIDFPMSRLYVVWAVLFPAAKKVYRFMRGLAPKRS